FGSIVSNFYAIVGRTLKLLTFTTSYFQANVVIPYIIVAPFFSREDHAWTDDADGRRLWPGRNRTQFLYRALPGLGVLQGRRRASDDVSLSNRRGASARDETAAHRTG